MGIGVIGREFVRDPEGRCRLADAGHAPQHDAALAAPSHGINAGLQLAFAIDEVFRWGPQLVPERAFLAYIDRGGHQPTRRELSHVVGEADARYLTDDFAAYLLNVSVPRNTEDLQPVQV